MARPDFLPGLRERTPRRNALVVFVYALVLYALYWFVRLVVQQLPVPFAVRVSIARVGRRVDDR